MRESKSALPTVSSKVMMVGVSHTVKSHFVLALDSLAKDNRYKLMMSSISIGFVDLRLNSSDKSTHVSISLWDTSSQARFKTFAKGYCSGASELLVVLDPYDKASNAKTLAHLDDIQRNSSSSRARCIAYAYNADKSIDVSHLPDDTVLIKPGADVQAFVQRWADDLAAASARAADSDEAVFDLFAKPRR